jgi:tetraacyldisaccharide 4'-kinase
MKKNSLEKFFLDNWYGKSRWTLLLFPLSVLFVLLSSIRRYYLINFKKRTPTLPVIVVGNISVGGTGKTPLIIALVKKLRAEGYNPGVISRGYTSQAPHYPYLVNQDSTAVEAGDEPLHVFQQTACPVAIGSNRFASISLLRKQNVDVILSDDGLQDYRLGRHLEIAVVDGQRWFGNGWRLPVGPLRETVSRLLQVDLLVVNNPSADSPLEKFHSMQINPCHWVKIKTGEKLLLNTLYSGKIYAVAGIGNPQRFYQTLKTISLNVIEKDFPDHHAYRQEDFDFAGDNCVVMTEKDAVKCKSFARDNWYSLAIESQLDDFFWQEFMQKIKSIEIQKYIGKL